MAQIWQARKGLVRTGKQRVHVHAFIATVGVKFISVLCVMVTNLIHTMLTDS